MKDTVYYLPGMGGRLETGLGEGIIQRGYNVVGQATLGAFKKLRFQEKIDIITTDLMESFWSDSSKSLFDPDPSVKLTDEINTAFTALGRVGLQKRQLVNAKYKLRFIRNVIV